MVVIDMEIKCNEWFSDGTNTALTIELPFKEPAIIRGPPSSNYLGITVQDDLSGLVRVTALLRSTNEV
jgi:hypothetical protein